MRTQAIALAVLVCSGAVLAQNPLGDDSGPNANDGQCDDTRFENIGTGNSNIVFWGGAAATMAATQRTARTCCCRD